MVRRYTTEEWVSKAKSVHGELYDYSRVEYKGADIAVIIGCEIHSWFDQLPRVHANQGGHCQTCMKIQRAKKRRKTTSQFIIEAREIHGDLYDYSRSIYTKAKEHVIIGCNECGLWFPQTPSNHTHKTRPHGCPDCAIRRSHENRTPESYFRDMEWRKLSQEEFKTRINLIFGGRLDTSVSEFKGTQRTVKIRCVECDRINEPIANKLLQGNYSCQGCRYKRTADSRLISTAEWILKAQAVHGNDFDYSETEYSGANNDVIIICNTCFTKFQCIAKVHIIGQGSCPKCRYAKVSEAKRIPMADVVARCKEVHSGKYEYPWNEIEYGGMHEPAPIVCPDHGEFFQKPSKHVAGQGCVKCTKKTQHKLFEILKNIYPDSTIHFDFRHPDLRFSESGYPMELDIWIPELKLGIEYQGEFHFMTHWGYRGMDDIPQNKKLTTVQARDEEKRRACEKKGITLLEVDYTWDRKAESILKMLEDNMII